MFELIKIHCISLHELAQRMYHLDIYIIIKYKNQMKTLHYYLNFINKY